jgi:hypothetical protein
MGVGAFIRARDRLLAADASNAAVRGVCAEIVLAFHEVALGRVSQQASSQPPVVIVLDAAGNITAMTSGGQRVLDDLRTPPDDGGLPSIVQAAATKARWSRATTSLTTRVRDDSGRWLRLHVAPIEGEVGSVAVLIETARPDDLVRILLESYGLTYRETEIVLLLARGLSRRSPPSWRSLRTPCATT